MIIFRGYAGFPLLLTLVAGSHAAALPDPTRPPGYSSGVNIIQQPEAENVEFSLTAIRINPNKRSAIINGQLIQQGDTVDSARLLEIHPAHVVLDHDNERIEVRLFRGLTKTQREPAVPVKISN